jgi:hypothetical protein
MDSRILDGSLKAISVPDLLTFINMIKKTGVLTLRQGDVARRVFWERGEMIFASSSEPEESLGRFLIRHGKITEDQNLKSGLLVEPGKRQGKILVQMGILTPKELWWAVKNQVLEIIYVSFSMMDGTFGFEETEQAYEEKIKLSTSTTNIIMEGIRRLDEWPRIRELIPNDRVVPHPTQPEIRDRGVKFLEGELAILALVDGVRDVRQIIHHSDLDEFETLRVLMALILARYVIIPEVQTSALLEDEDDAAQLESLVVSYNRIFSRVLEGLRDRLDAPEVEAMARGALETAKSEALEGVDFGDAGSLDVKALLANVADLPLDRRMEALDTSLSNLLSFFLFEASKHLGPEEKGAIYRMAGERAALKPAAN